MAAVSSVSMRWSVWVELDTFMPSSRPDTDANVRGTITAMPTSTSMRDAPD